MKTFFYFIMTITLLITTAACSDKNGDTPDDDIIWDIYPAGVMIQLVDEAGNNLLDPTVEGNWVGEPMWIGYQDEKYDAIWKREDLQPKTRFYMPHFYGTVWTGIFNQKYYALYFGEFDGSNSHDLKLKFGIPRIDAVYEFEYSHRLIWKNKEPHFDDHITYNGNEIEGSQLTLVLPHCMD